MSENRQVIIASLPTGALAASDFEVRAAPMPEPGEGEVLCKTLAITIGAGQRAGLQGSASYAGAPETGRVMGGSAVATVIASNSPDVAVGTLVSAFTGWQEHAAVAAQSVHVLPAGTDPATALGVFGTNGITAYFGLLAVGRPTAGETVVVSAAAGSVGHIVGQIAKIEGCRVVGIAGSADKCRMLTDELGFDAAVDYHDPDFRTAFKDATPDRIGVYFDNTGGPVLESALFRMATGGRIVCCGVVSQYDTSSPGPGPRGVPGLLVNNRVRMQGFLVFDYADRYDEARARMGSWIADGSLQPRTTEFQGIEEAPRAFVELLNGRTVGTTIVNF
ncbi:MAG: NADP-dependent oxidoreductase [Ilumatobacteraceae bacterium]|nr:NADP-dependent oxidoreductase [Ilumatobacteraceae bacterium]